MPRIAVQSSYPGSGYSGEHRRTCRIVVPLLQAFHQQRQRVSLTLKRLLKEAQSDDRIDEKTTVKFCCPYRDRCGGDDQLLPKQGVHLLKKDYEALRCYAGVAPITNRAKKFAEYSCGAVVTTALRSLLSLGACQYAM